MALPQSKVSVSDEDLATKACSGLCSRKSAAWVAPGEKRTTSPLITVMPIPPGSKFRLALLPRIYSYRMAASISSVLNSIRTAQLDMRLNCQQRTCQQTERWEAVCPRMQRRVPDITSHWAVTAFMEVIEQSLGLMQSSSSCGIR